MRIVVIIIVILAVGVIAYYTRTKNTTENNYEAIDQNIPVVNSNNLNQDQQSASSILGYITSDQVGPFSTGELVPNQTLLSQAGYSIRETTIFPEGMQTKEYIVSKNDKDLLTFQLRPISFGGVDVLVGDIRVTSPEFKTKEGIGVDSTVSDFIKAYPNYRFWYSQEEGEHFVLNTSSDKENLQFFLDRSGLLNPDKSFYPTRATISDFKTDAKIVSVRVY